MVKRDVIVSEDVSWALVNRKFDGNYRSIDAILRPLLGIQPGARSRLKRYLRELEYMKEKSHNEDPVGKGPHQVTRFATRPPDGEIIFSPGINASLPGGLLMEGFHPPRDPTKTWDYFCWIYGMTFGICILELLRLFIIGGGWPRIAIGVCSMFLAWGGMALLSTPIPRSPDLTSLVDEV